ncbi:alpha/beta hydrolase [Arthrobacter sp. VKM Ac-2550]|uniref:alpha/beta hydrolase n=1 Tax=Crystallibacter permensis TaxID=1938888 RepID=UPI002227EFCA|nr:phospholipase [Arthrobacter sp. VKM Ac-2550]MCW2134396.1 phospholipase/carboxylesterase [Arthrobacter sp. VKM Ac-2550]
MTQLNPHLARDPVLYGAPLTGAGVVVYAVHGRSQSPAFMQELANHIDLSGVAYLMPSAKDSTWYPAGFMEPLDKNQPRLDHALEAVGQHLGWLAERGIGPEKTVLLGFSQGACLLSEYLLRNQNRYAGVVLHTGGYIGPEEHEWPEEGGLDGVPVVMASAVDDVWVPLPRIEATAVALSKAGAAVVLNTYDETEHHINDDSVARIRKLLNDLLSSKES